MSLPKKSKGPIGATVRPRPGSSTPGEESLDGSHGENIDRQELFRAHLSFRNDRSWLVVWNFFFPYTLWIYSEFSH